MFHFNGYPPPLLGESSRGYFLRLVDINGYKSVENVARKLSVKFAFKSHPLTNTWTRVIEQLALAVYNDSNTLLTHTKAHWATPFYSCFDMSVTNLFHHCARLCPMCIQESPYLKAEWDFALNVVCIKHQCLLIDACPNCRLPIDWNRSQVCYCYQCETDLRNAEVFTLDSKHPVMKLARKLPKATREYIEDIIIACKRAYRPQDNMLANPALHILGVDDAVELLTLAYGLLHSAHCQREFLSWLNETRAHLNKISAKAVEEPFNVLHDSLNQIHKKEPLVVEFRLPENPINKIDINDISAPTPLGVKLGIPAARLKNPHLTLTAIDLPTQIGHERLAKVLNIPSAAIKHALDDGALIPMNNVATIRHTMLSLDNILGIITKVSIQLSDINSSFIALSQLSQGKPLSLFAAPFYVVIELILESKIHLFVKSSGDGLFDGYVKKDELFTQLTIFLEQEVKSLTILKLSQVLNVHADCIHKLVDMKQLKANNYFHGKSSNQKEVNIYTIKKLMDQYACLNREAYLIGIGLVACRKLLKAKSITPAIEISVNGNYMYLYDKSSDFRDVLAELKQSSGQ